MTGRAKSAKSAVPSSNVTATSRLARCRGVGEAGEAVGQGHHRRASSEKGHLLGERGQREIDLDRRAAADPVVDQHDEAGRWSTHGVDRGRRELQRGACRAHAPVPTAVRGRRLSHA